jgi:hypothetical protein
LQRRKSRLQLVTRGNEILEQLHFSVKMDDECLVFGSSQHLIQETLAGRSFLIQNIPLAHAGVDKQAEREGKVGFLRKIANRLRVTIFLEEEIVFGQIADDLAMLVSDSDRQSDHFDVHRQRGRRPRILGVSHPIGKQQTDQCQNLTRDEPVRE